MTDDLSPALSLEDERALIERLKQGDPAALDGLWRAHAGVLYAAVIFPRLPVRDLAEEVLQNTFLKAYDRIGSFQWQEHGILPWLKTIARNLVTDLHRKNQRVDRFCQGYGRFVETVQVPEHRTQRPDRMFQEREQLRITQERVRAILDHPKLNARYRQAIDMRIHQELDREACAEALGVKVGTFDVLFHRALKRFGALYREAYGEPPP